MTQKWNNYFYSHYKPVGLEWGRDDLIKYKHWYVSWVEYIEHHLHFVLAKREALELGCGIGAMAALLKERGCHVVGSDISDAIIARAKVVNPTISFLVYDVLKKYPKKKHFDYVFAFEVLEHLPDLEKGITNIHSVLKPGGWFIGSSPYPYPKNMLDPTHVHVHRPEYWKRLFQKLNFTDVRTYPLSFFPLLWRVLPKRNPVIPFYIPFPGFVSTTLIVAKKK